MSVADTPPKTFQLPPDKHRQAVEFHRRLNVLHFVGAGWTIAVLIFLTIGRTGPRIRDWMHRRTRSRFIAQAAAVAAILAIPWLAELPLAVYRHAVAMQYGISIHPWIPWFADVLKAAALTGPPVVLLMVAVLALARRWPNKLWICAWALGVATMIGATYLMPLVFDPLFFTFTPLARDHPELVRGLQNVAGRAGYSVPAERIFMMDAGRKTRAVNAYMTGFGPSRRIVIWDTTLAALSTPQVESVFAHELGHYTLHHIPKSIAAAAAGLFASLWLLNRLIVRMLRRWGPKLAIRELGDPAILPLVLSLASIGSFMAEPLVNTYSRWQEHQADIYELEAMHGLIPDAGLNSAQVNQIMGEIDLDDPHPGPFIRFWLYGHPPTNDRMLFAQQYDPWREGSAPRYIQR